MALSMAEICESASVGRVSSQVGADPRSPRPRLPHIRSARSPLVVLHSLTGLPQAVNTTGAPSSRPYVIPPSFATARSLAARPAA